MLSSIKRSIINRLGVSSDIELHLYKLLLYEPGGFFKPHRDTEKEENMFATMIIQFPAEHRGGELVVKHKTQKKIFDFDRESNFKFYCAAFYADCEHEVLPVISGYRFNLVYNVIYNGPGKVPSISTDITTPLCKYINNWTIDPSSTMNLT